jgi:D-cysteine desulfhydrase
VTAAPARIRTAEQRPLLALAPRLGQLPFTPLCAVTPVEPLPGFGERVWVKRDDLVSPIYGGNKVRRWEWLLADAAARGAKTLLTVGGLGSTQVTSLSAHGTALGFRVKALLFDQEASSFVESAQLANLRFGSTCIRSGGYASTAARTLLEFARTRDSYLIGPGASGALANLSYVDALLELKQQIDLGLAPKPDSIVVACGSGGTAVGLAVGSALANLEIEVVAVRITEPLASNQFTLRSLARRTENLLERYGGPSRSKPLSLTVEPRFLGPGYGRSTPAAEAGAKRFEELFGVAGECTYIGKALAALSLLARARPRETILFWNTLSTTGR